MNPIRKMIAEEIVRPMIQQHTSIAIGYILLYKPQTNTAIVEYANPHTGDRVYIHDLLISRPPFGFHPQEPQPGDRVVLGFEGGNPTSPIVISYFDEKYHRQDGPYENLILEYAASVPDILSYI